MLLLWCCFFVKAETLDQVRAETDSWRQQKRLIDLHQHINSNEAHLQRAAQIMDEAGVGVGVNLSGG